MRTTAVASALEALATNYNQRNDEAFLFELATTYHKGGEDALAIEKQEVVIAMYGDVDFYGIKGVVEQLLEAFGITYYDIVPETENPIFHPGQTAVMKLKNKPAVTVGRVHPLVQKNFGIVPDAYVAVLDFDILLECQRTDKKYKQLQKYPAITRDIAMVVSDEINVRQIEDVFRKTRSNILESYELFDVYKGKQVGEGLKSVAYSLSFRAADKTLTDDEVNTVMENIISELEKKLNAKLRL